MICLDYPLNKSQSVWMRLCALSVRVQCMLKMYVQEWIHAYKWLNVSLYKEIDVCNVSDPVCLCVCVQGSRVLVVVGSPEAREAVVIVEAGWRAEDSIAALGRLSAVGRAMLICHQHRQTPLNTDKTLTWLTTCEATQALMFCNC